MIFCRDCGWAEKPERRNEPWMCHRRQGDLSMIMGEPQHLDCMTA